MCVLCSNLLLLHALSIYNLHHAIALVLQNLKYVLHHTSVL